MSLAETMRIPADARFEVLQRKKRIEETTYTTITFAPNAENGWIELTLFGNHHDDLKSAKDRVQRALPSANSWDTSGARHMDNILGHLSRHNYPNFTNGNLRGLRYNNLGPIRQGRLDNQVLFEGLDEEITLTDSILPLMGLIDTAEDELHDAPNRVRVPCSTLRSRYKNLCAAAFDWLTREFENYPPPAKERVLLLRKIEMSPPETHHQVAEKFPGGVIDVIFLRRGNADNTITAKAFIVFASADAAKQSLESVKNCEPAKDYNHYNDCIKRRLVALRCIVDDVPLSGQRLRSSGKKGKQHLRDAIIKYNRAINDRRTEATEAEARPSTPPVAPEDDSTANVVAKAVPSTLEEDAVPQPDREQVQEEHKANAEPADVQMVSQLAQRPLDDDDDFEMEDVPAIREELIDGEGFVHVGLDREDEFPEDAADWADPDAAVPFHPPTTINLNHGAAAYTLHQALLQRYSPHELCEPRVLPNGKRKAARHTEYEYLQISEVAFWRILDILWANVGFRYDMEQILKKDDRKNGRNNFERLRSGIRPTGRFDPYSSDAPDVLTVPRSYKTLKYVQSAEALHKAMLYLRSLREFEWVGLDTEGGGHRGCGIYEPCETIQFATRKESFVIDARVCKAVVPPNVFRRFLTLLFTKGARFGMDFDEADREKIKALIDGDCAEAATCRSTISGSAVYDVRRLVARAYEQPNAEDEIDGPARPVGLPDYVRNRPRLSHYVHCVTQKKLNKAYTCSIWSVRPYLEEQLVYAHLDVICIMLVLQRCAKMPGGRDTIKSWFGDQALDEIDLDIIAE